MMKFVKALDMVKFVKALDMVKFVKALAMILVVAHSHLCWSSDQVGELDVQVEIEEDVYTFQPTNNGSGPMWCHGNTSIVRVGDDVFASGVETIPGAKPLNNCLPFLLHRTSDGWDRVFRDRGRTREPSPLAMFANGSVFLSVNPTRTPPDTYSGPAQPGIYEFQAASPLQTPRALQPAWEGEPAFSEHSYRTFVADGQRGEFILMQNVGYTHAEWSFRDRDAM